MIWNPPINLSLGLFELRIYGLFFALGITLSAIYLLRGARRLEYSDKSIEVLLVLCFVGIFLGARVVHCVFYDWSHFSTRILQIFIPYDVDVNGNYHFAAFQGLASHGGAIGVLLALSVFYVIYKRNLLTLLDVLAVATPLLATFIRLGNFFNSEIIGEPTTMPWAVTFAQVDMLPRHPSQLYEAAFYAVLFLAMHYFYTRKQPRSGACLGIVFVAIAAFRFLIEFIKIDQVDFEQGMVLNVGQLLSVPFFFVGVAILLCVYKKSNR